MTLTTENLFHRCRTCLVQLGDSMVLSTNSNCEHHPITGPDCDGELQDWMNNCIGLEQQDEDKYFPQQLCHECYETARNANEFRAKVQEAERRLLMRRIGYMEELQLVSCLICLRQYPEAVKSLTCKVKDAPHLQEWLEWSNSQQLSNEWYSQVICRFCYGKLRHCYEWRMAAEECADFLRTVLQNEWSMCNASLYDVTMPITKQETMDNTTELANESTQYLNDDFDGRLHAPDRLIKEEHFVYNQDNGYVTSTSTPTPTVTPNLTNFAELMDSSLLCLDAPYNAVPKDYYCKSCKISFSNSIFYDNHNCSSSAFNWRHDTRCLETTRHDAPRTRTNLKKVCQQCQKRFNKSILLEAHILHVHQGKERPFLCKYCTHAYITHTHLKRHVKTAHKDEWIKNLDDNSQLEFLDL